MFQTIPLLGTALLLLAAPASADAPSQPYAGLEARDIKALSDRDIADLRAGRGMGLALAAELNGYPGPIHVLEHADALGLSTEQRTATAALFRTMQAEAIGLGERLLEEERRLDRLFAERRVDTSSLAAATEAIGGTQAELREAHLRTHLAMVDLLTPEQVRRYTGLRGYAASGQIPAGRHGDAHHGGHQAPKH